MPAAYALNALPAREHTEFSRHLRTCESCATEVRELVATAARLGGAAADDRPPPENARPGAAGGSAASGE
ncbi:zf-HC2 domain-containing protein [Yinghuangia aomiensis]